MKRFVAAIIFLATISCAAAQTPPKQAGGPVAIGQAQLEQKPGGGVALVSVPASAQPEQLSVGTLGGQLLNWLALVFGAPVAGFLVMWLKALAKKAGIDVSQAAGDKLDDIIERGFNVAAAKAGADLEGQLTVPVQNKLLADAVAYAKAHGADTIKSLAASDSSLSFLKSFDPNDVKVQEALTARATAVLNKLTPEAVLQIDPAAAPVPPNPAA